MVEIISAQTAAHYRCVRDLFIQYADSMTEAQSLYLALNFRTIEAYCYNPLENTSYMELDL